MPDSRRVVSVFAYGMGGGTHRRQVHSGTGSPTKPPGPTDRKRRLIRGEGLVARISNDYRPQLPVVGKDIPEPAVPYHVGTARLGEAVNIRTRSLGRAVCRPYSDSEESDNDVLYAEDYDSALQQISLRNEWPTQMTVDSCGERCAQLDDVKWFLPTDERAEDLGTPESEIDTSDSEGGVDLLIQTRLLCRRSRLLSSCYALRLSLRRDIRRAVMHRCPGDCVGDMMSGRRTIL